MTAVQTWLDKGQLEELDAYRRKQQNPPTRPKAIR
jgi:hypothetical protein